MPLLLKKTNLLFNTQQNVILPRRKVNWKLAKTQLMRFFVVPKHVNERNQATVMHARKDYRYVRSNDQATGVGDVS